MGDVVGNVAEPLPQREHPQAFALARPIEQGVELRAACRADRRRDGHTFLRKLIERVAHTVAEACVWTQRPHALRGTVKAIRQDTPGLTGRLLLARCVLEPLIRLGQGHIPPDYVIDR